ncbi:uncharacterized protein LOC125179171, partial [Hyalella azteca]|uniref:Uncharacterized protein LOC125179171 n=1 Tax=Hyalella azteca TaxID=294128 RepID=A0A979FVU6_HYAAZ
MKVFLPSFIIHLAAQSSRATLEQRLFSRVPATSMEMGCLIASFFAPPSVLPFNKLKSCSFECMNMAACEAFCVFEDNNLCHFYKSFVTTHFTGVPSADLFYSACYTSWGHPRNI